mgnify:CR=1 FL=1
MTAHKTGYSWMTASIKLSWVNSCISLSLSFILDIKHRVRLDDCVLSTELDEWEWMKITVDLLIANWHFDLIYSDQSCTGSNIYSRRESSGLFAPRLSLPSFPHLINRFSHMIYRLEFRSMLRSTKDPRITLICLTLIKGVYTVQVWSFFWGAGAT